MPLLDVRDLRITLPTAPGAADAPRGVSFALERGHELGQINESGCGKSMTSLAPMGRSRGARPPAGSSKLPGETLVGADQDKLCALRGDLIGMVFQEPMTALKADAWRPAIGCRGRRRVPEVAVLDFVESFATFKVWCRGGVCKRLAEWSQSRSPTDGRSRPSCRHPDPYGRAVRLR